MHASSYLNMKRFVETHLAARAGATLRVADIGSQIINGSYRPLFDQPGWQYVGIDMAEGAGVDLVLGDVYRWTEIADESFDVVVSGQALEHIEFFWLTMLEIARIARPGGLVCLIAPSGGYEHRYPVDCWRFYPDGMRALARYAGLEVVEAYAQWNREEHPEMDPIWQDCVLVARKPGGPVQ
jgi:SAM-dependent methyltransferase